MQGCNAVHSPHVSPRVSCLPPDDVEDEGESDDPVEDDDGDESMPPGSGARRRREAGPRGSTLETTLDASCEASGPRPDSSQAEVLETAAATRPAADPMDTVHCARCALGSDEDFMLLCDGNAGTCSTALHTYCCTPALACVPRGDWYCPDCTQSRLAQESEAMTERQRVKLASRISAAAAPAVFARTPLADRAPAPTAPEARLADDGVTYLQLADDAPRLEFDLEIQQGTIVDASGARLAGTVYDEAGLPVLGSELSAHPDRRSFSKPDNLPSRVLTESNVDIDLGAPLVAPPPGEAGQESAWEVRRPDGTIMLRVVYMPAGPAGPAVATGDGPSRCCVREPSLAELSRVAVEAVRSHIHDGLADGYTADEKTGGGYLVAGNGCMAKDPPPAQVVGTLADGSTRPMIVPYTRLGTLRPALRDTIAAVAPLMGSMAQRVGARFPAVTSGLAAAVRRHAVVGDTFCFPEHIDQRFGLAADASDHGSIAAHQVALRLAGRSSVARPCAAESSRVAHQSTALHTDVDDARRAEGSPLLYATYFEAAGAASGGSASGGGTSITSSSDSDLRRPERPMRSSDLVVFERASGGRAVRVATCCPAHHVAVIFRSDAQLHANVFPDDLTIDPPPGVLLLRIVPYGRRGIDRFCEAVAREPALWSEAVPKLDERLRQLASRAQGESP